MKGIVPYAAVCRWISKQVTYIEVAFTSFQGVSGHRETVCVTYHLSRKRRCTMLKAFTYHLLFTNVNNYGVSNENLSQSSHGENVLSDSFILFKHAVSSVGAIRRLPFISKQTPMAAGQHRLLLYSKRKPLDSYSGDW